MKYKKMVCMTYAPIDDIQTCLADGFFNLVVTLTDQNFESVTGVSINAVDGPPSDSIFVQSDLLIDSYTPYINKGWIISVSKSTATCNSCELTKSAMSEIANSVKDRDPRQQTKTFWKSVKSIQV